MKITTFNPIIITKNAAPTVKLFEELGFHQRHQPDGSSAAGYDYKDYRMTDDNGFHVDVAYTSGAADRDFIAIRINVDDFNEAYDFLVERGFKSMTGKPATETESSRGLSLMSPSGIIIVLCQHIK